MNKILTTLATVLSMSNFSFAQAKPADSVVVRIGESSKMILSVHSQKDLETMKHYDFQSLMNDMIRKMEQNDTTPLAKPSTDYLRDTVKQPTVTHVEVTRDDNDESWERRHHRNRWNKRTYHSFNIDVGLNNFLANGKFPDQSNAQYSVKPMGSWYVALNSLQRTHVTGKFFVEWGVGVSWYNFKFQDATTLLVKDNTTTTFTQDTRALDFNKSKLTATYLNASFVPVIDFGGGGRKTTIFDGSRVDFSSRGNHSNSFRIGAGPYVGYRIDSYTKQAYKDQQGKERSEVHHDNYYLNDIRYGLRVQFGYNDVDFFCNYDMNSLFVEGKGPKVNAFTFGITF